MPLRKNFSVLLAIFLVTNAAANQAHDRIFKLEESKRNEALTELMARSGDPCEVKMSFFQGFDERKTAFWSVACYSGKKFSIMFNDDGSTMTYSCKASKTILHVQCFKPL